VKFTDPDGNSPFDVLNADKLTKEEARTFIADDVISRTDLPVTRQMYTKGMNGDTTPYVNGPTSNIAQEMKNDRGAYANMAIQKALESGRTSGVGGQTGWTNDDLKKSIGSSTFSWEMNAYNKETGVATVGVHVKDHFDFNPGDRGFPGENLNTIGRKAGLSEYDVKVDYQIQFKLDKSPVPEN
jgi:hypothetical protein